MSVEELPYWLLLIAGKFFSLVKAIRTWVFEFNQSLSQIF